MRYCAFCEVPLVDGEETVIVKGYEIHKRACVLRKEAADAATEDEEASDRATDPHSLECCHSPL